MPCHSAMTGGRHEDLSLIIEYNVILRWMVECTMIWAQCNLLHLFAADSSLHQWTCEIPDLKKKTSKKKKPHTTAIHRHSFALLLLLLCLLCLFYFCYRSVYAFACGQNIVATLGLLAWNIIRDVRIGWSCSCILAAKNSVFPVLLYFRYCFWYNRLESLIAKSARQARTLGPCLLHEQCLFLTTDLWAKLYGTFKNIIGVYV